MMPILYQRDLPLPKCRHCGERMDYWIPGLADEKHAHPGCEGRAMANASFDRNRELFDEARKLKAELRAEKKRIFSA